MLHAWSGHEAERPLPALLAARAARMAPQRLAEMATVALPTRTLWRVWQSNRGRVLAIAIGAGVAACVARRLVLRRRATDAFALVCLAAVALWPWDEGGRLVAPLTPIALGAVIEFGAAAWGVAARRRPPNKPQVAGSRRRAMRLLVAGAGAACACAWAIEWRIDRDGASRRAARTATRVASAERIGCQLLRVGGRARPVAVVTEQGDDAKVTAMLAAYLAGVPCATVDVATSGLHDWPATLSAAARAAEESTGGAAARLPRGPALVVSRLDSSGAAPGAAAFERVAQVERFEVWRARPESLARDLRR
ncbi:MAG: hypothetical protein U1A27_10465 [Phycisphaerae bacterium]